MELTGFDGPVDQNSTVTLTCAVYEARPPALLTWYNGSRKLEEKENNITKENSPKVSCQISYEFHVFAHFFS